MAICRTCNIKVYKNGKIWSNESDSKDHSKECPNLEVKTLMELISIARSFNQTVGDAARDLHNVYFMSDIPGLKKEISEAEAKRNEIVLYIREHFLSTEREAQSVANHFHSGIIELARTEEEYKRESLMSDLLFFFSWIIKPVAIAPYDVEKINC